MEPQEQHRPVRQLRVVVEAHDYEMALAFFRDALGLPASASFADGPEDRVAILEAGRATVEITSTAHKQVIDRIEADGRPRSGIQLAFELDDAQTTTDRLQGAGGQVVSAPVRTRGSRWTPGSTPRPGCRSPSSRNCSPQKNEPPSPGSTPDTDSRHSSSEAA